MIFFRRVMGVFLTEILILGLNFLAGVLFARLLTPSDRGVLALAMLLPVTLAYFSDIGISQAIVYLINRQKRPVVEVLSTSLALGLLFGSSIVTLLWIGRSWVLGRFLKDVPESIYLTVLLLLPALLVDAYLLSILRARGQFAQFNARRLAGPVLLLAAALVLTGWMGWGIQGAVLAFVFSTLAGLGLALVWTARFVPVKVAFHPPLAAAAVRFGVKSYLQNLVGHLHYRVDVYLLALFLPPSAVAYYAIATSAAEFIFYLPDAVGTVLFPRLAEEAGGRIHVLTAEVLRHTLMATGLACLLLLPLGWLLIPVMYGQAYLPAVLPFLLLVPGSLAMSVYKVLSRNFTSRDRQQVTLLAGSAALTLNVALNLVLIPAWGVSGAAVASLLSYFLAAGVLLIAFRWETGLPWRETLWVQKEDLKRYGELYRAMGKRLGWTY